MSRRKSIERGVDAFSDIIRKLPPGLLPDIHSVQRPLHKVLWTLAAAKEAGYKTPLTVLDIRNLLETFEVALTPTQISDALSRAGDKIIKKDLGSSRGYLIALPGRAVLEKLTAVDGVDVFYVEPGKRWSARRKVEQLAGSLDGQLLINDRYYGERTIYALEVFSERKENVRFITAQTSESKSKLSILFRDLMNEKTNLEVRLFPRERELHDRYILSDNALVLLGHGIKDLGGSESFVVVLDSRVVQDVISMVRASFESRWNSSAPI